MSYPQPDADQYALRGGDFFRLSTGLTSPGDLYESQQGSHAFCLGPQSDVANVNIGYYDDQAQTFLNQIQIGPNRSFIGRLDARNESKYAPSNRPGRILIWPSDLFDPSFKPAGIVPNVDTLTFVTPQLEVIEYFSPQGSLDVRRNDKTFRFQELELPISNAFTVIPYWGRRSASARVTNLTHHDMLWEVQGITYFINDGFAAIQTPIDTATILSGGQRQTFVRDTVNGRFDALLLITSASVADGPTPIQLTISDDA